MTSARHCNRLLPSSYRQPITAQLPVLSSIYNEHANHELVV